MPTSTEMHERELTEFEPRERQLYNREGFDRDQVRYELANSNNIDLNSRWVETEEVMYLNHETADLPDGPTGIGEGGGAGVDFVMMDGDRFPTNRYAQGFTLNQEDLETGHRNIGRQRDKIMEMVDFYHDKNFLMGFNRLDGTWVPGVFEWLDTNIPSERVIDCSQYTSSGDNTDYKTAGTQENVIKFDAYQKISNRLMSINNPTWGAMIGLQDALSHFNKRAPSDGGTDPRDTYWARLNVDGRFNEDPVGIQDRIWMPPTSQFSDVPEDGSMDPLTFSLASGNSQWNGLANHEAYILPDLEQVRSKYWNLYEQATPRLFSNDESVGRTRYDYVWRYTHDFDVTGEHPNATDAIKLINIPDLFTGV